MLISLLEKGVGGRDKENCRLAKIQIYIFPLGNIRTEREVKIFYAWERIEKS